MRIKNYKQILKESDKGFKWSSDDYNDDDYSDDYNDDDYNDDDDGEDDGEGEFDHLLYLLRLMFKNSGIQVEITKPASNGITKNNDFDISIIAFMNEEEKLKDVIKVFEIAKKIKRDTLDQYESAFEIWYDKDNRTMLTFDFYYRDDLDNNLPF